MSAETETAHVVVVERHYRSAPERVWAAWTDPRELEQWFFPLDNPGVRVPQFDLRVGGDYKIQFASGPGMTAHTAIGTFREVVPQKRLVLTWNWEGDPPMPGSVVKIDFERAGPGTKVTLRHEGLPAADVAAMHDHGWSGILDRFAALEESNANKQVVRRFIEQGAAKNDAKVIEESIASDFVWHNPMPGAPATREGVKMAVAGFRQAFPDYHLTVLDLLADGDKVASRIRFVGTNQGSLMGAPPTGKKVDVEFWHIERVRDGKIVERWRAMERDGQRRVHGAVGNRGAKIAGCRGRGGKAPLLGRLVDRHAAQEQRGRAHRGEPGLPDLGGDSLTVGPPVHALRKVLERLTLAREERGKPRHPLAQVEQVACTHERVRGLRELELEEAAAWPKHPPDLLVGARAVADVSHHEGRHDGVEASTAEGHALAVALDEARAGQEPVGLQTRPCAPQHRGGEVEARERGLRIGTKEGLREVARPAAEVEAAAGRQRSLHEFAAPRLGEPEGDDGVHAVVLRGEVVEHLRDRRVACARPQGWRGRAPGQHHAPSSKNAATVRCRSLGSSSARGAKSGGRSRW